MKLRGLKRQCIKYKKRYNVLEGEICNRKSCAKSESYLLELSIPPYHQLTSVDLSIRQYLIRIKRIC